MSNGRPASHRSIASCSKRSIGYKRPPADKRFAKGRSGNPKGRPKGAPNAADILKNLFNKKIPVREGNRIRKLPTCEAIIRLLVATALRGDAQALNALNWIREKFTAPDVTSEEREKRTLRLPRSYTLDEHDLLTASAREKERQHYLAIADRQAITGETPLAPIYVGDQLAKQSKVDDALAAYNQQIANCEAKLANNSNDEGMQKHYERALARIGLLADQLLFAGEFEEALKCADQAIAHGVEAMAHGIPINLIWVELIRAHATMFLGKADEAQKFYLNFHGDKHIVMTNWEMVILQDFAQLRKAGLPHPLMIEIEQKLANAGWTASGHIAEKTPASVMNSDDRYFAIMNPDDLKTAALYTDDGRLDDAKNIYEHILTKCATTLTNAPGNIQARNTRETAIEHCGRLARQFLERGRFPTALECSEQLIALAPHRYELQAIRAHALMFIGHSNEARDLYLRYRGQKIGENLWETAVRVDFEKFRQKNFSNSLMDEIAALFNKNDRAEPETIPVHAEVRDAAAAAPQPDDIASGDRLFAQGKVDEAIEVYRRRIKICQTKLAICWNMQASDDLHIAVDRISDVALYWTLKREFQMALDLTAEALGLLENSPRPGLRRAHALMFLDRADEARALYHRYTRGKGAAERIWQGVVREDFAKLRDIGLSHPLMDEIERDFAEVAPAY